MKIVLAILSIGYLVLGSVTAQAFPLEGTVQVTPNRVVVEFCNDTCNYVLSCRAQATGLLNTGYPISAGGIMSLPPGECGYAYVYANYPYYFVNGQGQADCQ